MPTSSTAARARTVVLWDAPRRQYIVVDPRDYSKALYMLLGYWTSLMAGIGVALLLLSIYSMGSVSPQAQDSRFVVLIILLLFVVAAGVVFGIMWRPRRAVPRAVRTRTFPREALPMPIATQANMGHLVWWEKAEDLQRVGELKAQIDMLAGDDKTGALGNTPEIAELAQELVAHRAKIVAELSDEGVTTKSLIDTRRS